MPKKITETLSAPNWMGTKGRFVWRLLPAVVRRKSGNLILQTITRFVIEKTTSIKIGATEFTLCAANPRLDHRNKTYSTKEPATLKWIESFSDGAVLWDIGANIGLYSIYAAKVRNCRVIAFEPSVFCLEFLARNIWLNKLQQQITIVPNPLSDQTQENLLTLHSREWGESSNSFGTTLNQDGQEIDPSFVYKILGVTMDEAISKLNIPEPEHIKIDVDGIEPMILAGGLKLLKHIQSISIEVPTYRGANEKVSEILTASGLNLVAEDGNQIWRRP